MTSPNCPNCGKQTVRTPNCYALDGIFYSGLVCCGSLWTDDDEEGFGNFMAAAKARLPKLSDTAETALKSVEEVQ